MGNNSPKTAMIFGAGLGKRMRPLTDNMPKPLVPVNGKPIIEYTLDNLRDFGVNKVVVNTHYKAEQLTEYLLSYTDVEVVTIHEDTLLNTGGGLLQALPLLGEDPFFVINGDIIWQNSSTSLLGNLSNAWEINTRAVLALKEVEKAIGYDGRGDFFISESGEVMVKESDNRPYVFCGIQILSANLFEGRDIKPFSIIEIYKEQITDGVLSGVKAIVHDGKWLHIGTPEGVTLAEQNL